MPTSNPSSTKVDAVHLVTLLPVSAITTSAPSTTRPRYIIGNRILIASPDGHFLMDGKTLSPGDKITISGMVYNFPETGVLTTSVVRNVTIRSSPIVEPSPIATPLSPSTFSTWTGTTDRPSDLSILITSASSIDTATPTELFTVPESSTATESRVILSRKARIGIATGASIALLTLISLLAIFFFRYGKRHALRHTRTRDRRRTPPPKLGKSRNNGSTERSWRIEKVHPQVEEPYELWSPAISDLEKKGSTELEGSEVRGMQETKQGKRAELEGRGKGERVMGHMMAKDLRRDERRRSETGSWLVSWGRWVKEV